MRSSIIVVGFAFASLGPLPLAAQANPHIIVDADWLQENIDDPDLVVLHVDGGIMSEPIPLVPRSRLLNYNLIAMERNGFSWELAEDDDLVEAFRAVGVSNHNRVVIVSGLGHIGARAFLTLDYLGHGEMTSVLDGGLEAWTAAGRPTTTEFEEAPRGTFEADIQEDILVDAGWIVDHLDDESVTLIDARPDDEFTGERPGRDYLQGGHIPGAYNLYWRDLTSREVEGGDGQIGPEVLRDLGEVQARFDEAGATATGVVVNYCLIGMRASYTYMVSRYLGYDAKFYDPSWNEWGARDDLPIVSGKERG